MPRKGHRKSRAGCIVCKKRRVKCDEIRPRCGSCTRLTLECRYPIADPIEKAVVAQPQSSMPSQLRMEDLRFFQHFLFSAYPSLPVDGWSVWQQLGQMAHHYDFLAHAMLGLGASHLDALSPGSDLYRLEALNHRVKAVKSLNEHLAKSELRQAEVDAGFGTLLSLTFQSAYMQDGVVDYFTMVRGCYVVAESLLGDYAASAFVSFARESYAHRVRKLVSADPEQSSRSLNMDLAAQFCGSIKRVSTLCRSVHELEYLAVLQRIVTYAATKPTESYQEHSYMYDKLGELTNSEFALLVDLEDPVSQLILMHALVVEFLMGRKVTEDGDKLRVLCPSRNGFDCRKRMIVTWIKGLAEKLPSSHQPYAERVVEFTRRVSEMGLTEDEIWTLGTGDKGTLLALQDRVVT